MVEASVMAVEMIPVVGAVVSFWGNASPYLVVRQGGEILLPPGTDIHPVNNYLDLFVDFVHHPDDTDWNHLLFVLLIPY